MILTFCYRLLPSKRQHRALEGILESQRQLYNAALQERVEAYRKAGITRTYMDQCKALSEWRQSDSEAASLPVVVQRWTLKRVDDAYLGFYQRMRSGDKPGFPRFRSKGRFTAFGIAEFRSCHLKGCRLKLKGMPGGLRIHVHRPLPELANILSCVVARDAKGWRIGFAVKVTEAAPKSGNRVVGVDLGISTFAALSDGGFIPSLRAALRSERRIRIAHRALMRKTRGSNQRRKARTHLARCHAAIARARADHLHQASARLVRDYDVIVIERLSVKGLAQSALAKHVRDAAWGRFIKLVRYKAEWAGSRLIEIDPHDTSQECSRCGIKVPKGLSDRMHECRHCGLKLDRDLNAARNILGRAGVGPGLPNAAGYGMRAGGNIGAAWNQDTANS